MRLTRLHVRYDAVSFPEDLIFVEIGDRANFQDRYIMRHPAVIGQSCPAAEASGRTTGALEARGTNAG